MKGGNELTNTSFPVMSRWPQVIMINGNY